MNETRINICYGKHCCRSAPSLVRAATDRVRALHHADEIKIEQCGCLGECQKGPNIRIESKGESVLHLGMTSHKLTNRIDELAGKKPIIIPGKAKQSVNDLLKGGF